MYEQYTVLSITGKAFESLWLKVAGFVPNFIAAIVVFFVGWLLAILAGKIIWHIVQFIQLDRGLESVGFKKIWERSGYKLDTGKFFYELVKWFVIVGFLTIATEILGLDKVTEFLGSVLSYLPNVAVAAFILIIGILVANFAEHAVRSSLKVAELHSANFLGSVTRWAILVFALLAALDRLEVLNYLFPTAIIALFAALALAFGLAFGLGGRDHADEWLTNWKKHIKD